MEFVAFDVETANFQRDSVCSIGLAFVKNGKIVKSTHTLVRPVDPCFSNTWIHGISESDVRHAPTLAEVWRSLRKQLRGKILVAHYAAFDVHALTASLASCGVRVDPFPFICSCNVAKVVWSSFKNHKLKTLARMLDIELNHHVADSDAKACASIILQAASQLGCASVQDLANQTGVGIGRLDLTEISTVGQKTTREKESFAFELPTGCDPTKHPLYRKHIAITGTLTIGPKRLVSGVMQQLEGSVKSSVTLTTDYLVVGRQDPRKFAKGCTENEKIRTARELIAGGTCKIQMIDEAEFIKLLFETT